MDKKRDPIQIPTFRPFVCLSPDWISWNIISSDIFIDDIPRYIKKKQNNTCMRKEDLLGFTYKQLFFHKTWCYDSLKFTIK